MSKWHRDVRRPLETAAARVGLALIPRLPRPVVLGLAWLGGNLGFGLDRRGWRIGLANLDVAFGDAKTPAAKRAILRAAYVTMARTFLDVIWFGTRSAERLGRYVVCDESLRPIFRDRNQICVSAHFGNWEVIGQWMALRGFPIHSIAMPVKNREVNRLLIARREVTGQQIIPREGALRKLLAILRAGGKAAFLVDQNTKPSEGGIWADYFGLPVPVTPAPAALAAKTGSAIFIVFAAPHRGGRYRIYVSETIPPPEHADAETTRLLTQRMLAVIEREVRAHPECWLWMYKRWLIKDPSVPVGRYPFYATR
jgi:lauroyl/myristoyl acyltransferase